MTPRQIAKPLIHEDSIISSWGADLYDLHETGEDDVQFLLSIIGPAPRRVLEVACGSGRILVPLAKAGHAVSGFDADEYMLAKISAKAEGLSNIEWQKADAAVDEWGTNFDVVVLAGNILFNIVTDMDYAKAQEQFIRKAAAALVPGGQIYVEYQPGGHPLTRPESSFSGGVARVIWEGIDHGGNHGRMTIIAGNYDATTQLDHFTRRFEITLKSGETVLRDIPCVKHAAKLDQLRGWLRNAGFTIEFEYGDFSGGPIRDDSVRAIIYARKCE